MGNWGMAFDIVICLRQASDSYRAVCPHSPTSVWWIFLALLWTILTKNTFNLNVVLLNMAILKYVLHFWGEYLSFLWFPILFIKFPYRGSVAVSFSWGDRSFVRHEALSFFRQLWSPHFSWIWSLGHSCWFFLSLDAQKRDSHSVIFPHMRPHSSDMLWWVKLGRKDQNDYTFLNGHLFVEPFLHGWFLDCWQCGTSRAVISLAYMTKSARLLNPCKSTNI
jgi:hypothetical protein